MACWLMAASRSTAGSTLAALVRLRTRHMSRVSGKGLANRALAYHGERKPSLCCRLVA